MVETLNFKHCLLVDLKYIDGIVGRKAILLSIENLASDEEFQKEGEENQGAERLSSKTTDDEQYNRTEIRKGPSWAVFVLVLLCFGLIASVGCYNLVHANARDEKNERRRLVQSWKDENERLMKSQLQHRF